MMLYTYINDNLDRLRREICLGIVPCSLLRQWEIYSRYDAYKKMGYKVMDAVLCVCNDMQVSERFIFRIIKKMEQTV